MSSYILPFNTGLQATVALVGGKGASLSRLVAAGLPVPPGFHLTTTAYRHFVAENQLQSPLLATLAKIDPAQVATLESAAQHINALFQTAPVPAAILTDLTQAYLALTAGHPTPMPLAVRSSATAEDLPNLSFAGQQETYLNIHGAADLALAVKRCWASLWTARAIAYRLQHHIDPDQVSLAVVVQTLVPATAAGVLFTANPLNGQRGQMVINATWGLGEALVSGHVTPDTVIVAKATQQVLQQTIATKSVMTTCAATGTVEQPTPATLQQAPVLAAPLIAALGHLGQQIEALYQMPMDIEWVLAGPTLWVVQARPITALPAPPAPITISWSLPNPKGHYARSSITELMPNPLSPLFATAAIPAINQGLRQVLHDLGGISPEIIPANYFVIINGYAYQDLHFTPRQIGFMLAQAVPVTWRLLKDALPFWRKSALPHYAAVAAHWHRPLASLTAAELFQGIKELVDVFGYHLATLMTTTMGTVAGSEFLFTFVYERFIQSPTDPPAPTFLLGLENRALQNEKALYALSQWCLQQPPLAAWLTATPTPIVLPALHSGAPPTRVPLAIWIQFQNQWQAHLTQYGYAVYELDFMKPLPQEAPAPLVEMLKHFLRGKGQSPAARQQALSDRREQATATIRARHKSGWQRWAFDKALAWAQALAPLREDGLAEAGLGYPTLHRLLHELGQRLVAAHGLAQPTDIFWLEWSELLNLVEATMQDRPLPTYTTHVGQRQALWQAQQALIPPPQLPPKAKLWGLEVEGLLAMRAAENQGPVLKGLGASPGQVTAPACVLHDPADFDQMRPGTVLVAPITTPAWTPLFAQATAIVTDIGGPLSHSSIVAREYGIPAVLGTGIATKRIHSGESITVDGTTGTVRVVTQNASLN